MNEGNDGRNGSGRFHWNDTTPDELVTMTTSQSVTKTTEHPRKRIEWLKLVGGIVVALFVAGFATAQVLSAYATRDEIRLENTSRAALTDRVHDEITTRVRTVEEHTSQIRVDQARSEERQRLIDARIELLVERSSTPRRGTETPRESELENRVRAQEHRVEVSESSPMAGIEGL